MTSILSSNHIKVRFENIRGYQTSSQDSSEDRFAVGVSYLKAGLVRQIIELYTEAKEFCSMLLVGTSNGTSQVLVAF
jgi:hypothetical protein